VTGCHSQRHDAEKKGAKQGLPFFMQKIENLPRKSKGIRYLLAVPFSIVRLLSRILEK
jgi:hypothetical protein